ncbi:hypothetical protein [Rathayibacter sp. VKM Ac-2760]|uniref:hypothetical protein n=1 Tax=Rathayibacter sp. VKM Ac-2760 TaxID=2609253 RepID=UPI0013173CA5|nr:hypothetical protein [Rathayibacter sp. VKM Ac-2760]QHC58920.1 hypothetical protein GSU72_10435 [Rathayibacter sp. VKM Ac-2760]
MPTTSPLSPSRRSVTAAAAWSLPVLAAAATAPLAAASTIVVVPGQPDTYPNPSFSATRQSVGDPSLKATNNTGYARTDFTAVPDDGDYASYKTGWTYVVTSAKPVANISYDTTSLAIGAQGGLVNGLYTYSWTLTRSAETTWVRVKPTAYPQEIRFVLTDTTSNPQGVVGNATATSKP